MQIEIQNARGELLETSEMTERRDVPFNHLSITEPMLAQSGERITFRFSLPVLDIQAVWSYRYLSRYAPFMGLPWDMEITSAQQDGIPYLAFLRMDQINTAAVALTCVHDDVRIHCKMDQMRCAYAVDVTVAVMPDTPPFELLLSFAEKRWDLLLEDWRKLVVPRIPDFPAAAYAPVYCTWYAAHGALTPEYLDRNAKLAAELGCGTFIVDDGWSYDEMKRVCLEKAVEGWYLDIGNWTVSEKKLPGFKKHIEYAQSLGLKYLLWCAPFLAGIRSAEYKAVPEAEREKQFNGAWSDVAFLEPESPAAGHVIDLLKKLMTDLELDGLKIDFLDIIEKSIGKPRGRACRRYFSRLAEAVRAVKPDALMEFRQSYATPQMLEFGTQFRAGDVPFDFLRNLGRLAQIRIVLGDGVPCHADPVYFHPQEKPENVARHMIAALAGVPMLSMELGDLTAEQKTVIGFWLAFYREHLETFAFGHWEVLYAGDAPDLLTVQKKDEVISIVCGQGHGADLAEKFAGKQLYLLNMSSKPLEPVSGARARNCFGKAVPGAAAPVAGMAFREKAD